METFKVVLIFESLDKILWCDHSNETWSAVVSHGTICFVGFEKVKFRIFLKILLWPLLGVKGLNGLLTFNWNIREQGFNARVVSALP